MNIFKRDLLCVLLTIVNLLSVHIEADIRKEINFEKEKKGEEFDAKVVAAR
jgi:hypothetical protein